MGAKQPFLFNLVDDLSELMKDAYPVLIEKKDHIKKTIQNEEHKFFETLEKGIKILDEEINNLSGNQISGEVVFKLHDTFGFPYDLTADIAREKNLEIDSEGFAKSMQAQKDSSKLVVILHLIFLLQLDVDATTFQGYEFLDSESKVLSIWNGQDLVDIANENDEVFIALNQTSFYAESGGQVGDTGTFDSNSCSGVVLDCKKQGKVFLHKAKIESGSLKCGDVVNMSVEKNKRRATAIHHSATQFTARSSKKVLGDHVQQKGSQVDHTKLRFDFAHSAPLTADEISKIEHLVNNQSLLNTKVSTTEMELKDAIDSGAEALFGEKYDDKVRVLDMGEESFL